MTERVTARVGEPRAGSIPPLVLGPTAVRHHGVAGPPGFVVAPARHLHTPDARGQQSAVVTAGPHILIAPDLTPADTAGLDLADVAGFCTSAGGPTSHAVQVAYTLGIPTVVAAGNGVLDIPEGQMCALDGSTGTLYAGLTDATLKAATAHQDKHRARALARREQDTHLTTDTSTSPDTGTGRVPLTLTATIMRPSQAAQVHAAGAQGVGLLATELLFLGREHDLTEEEQHYQAYRAIARAAHGPVTLRTLDIGGDKDVPSLNLPREDNPFLGVRGLRLSLRRPDLFLPQLRAAYRAARDDGAPLRLMFPMVTSVQEFIQAAQTAREVQAMMGAPGLPLGVMVEVPACALAIDQFIEHVDFLSIGTNDLAQYLTATSRTNPDLAANFDPLHIALTRTVHTVATAGAEHEVPVSACGALAGDPVGAVVLASLGVTALTVALPYLHDVRRALRRTDTTVLRTIRQDALTTGGTQHLHDQVTGLLDL